MMQTTPQSPVLPGSEMPAVRFDRVTKRYGGVIGVNEVSFDIAQGSLVTLLGPSGCGKTTTLRLIAGLEGASDGRILIGGADVTALSAAERDVSMVFQSYALFPHMSVMENVCYGLRASGLSKAEAMARAADKLALLGLTGFEARQPSELSGGQQQRVAVARAIVLEPKVLLFDEPLSNLDAKLRRRVREEIRALQQDLKLTVVYVTHDQEEALAVSDRIIVMKAGRIAQDGTPRDLYARPASRFIADFMGDANLIAVEVAAVAGERATVRLGGLTFDLPASGLGVGPACLAARPEALRLGRGPGGLPGRVVKASYLGGHMEYRVAAEGVSADLLVFADDVAAPLAEGEAVTLTPDLSRVVLVPATPDSP